jgi:hypothetical protein
MQVVEVEQVVYQEVLEVVVHQLLQEHQILEEEVVHQAELEVKVL